MARNARGGGSSSSKAMESESLGVIRFPSDNLGADKKIYAKLITDIKSILSTRTLVSEISEIRCREGRILLPEPGEVGGRKLKYFDIDFHGTSVNGETRACCRFLAHNLYFIGFQANGEWNYLNGWFGHKNKEKVEVNGITDSMNMLPHYLSVEYCDLEKGDTTRETLHYGRHNLNRAIEDFSNYIVGNNAEYLRGPILLMTQMVSEALRFPPIYDAIHACYEDDRKLKPDLIAMENYYDKVCWEFLGDILEERMKNTMMSKQFFEKVSAILYYTSISYKLDEVRDGEIVKYKFKVMKTQKNRGKLGLTEPTDNPADEI